MIRKESVRVVLVAYVGPTTPDVRNAVLWLSHNLKRAKLFVAPLERSATHRVLAEGPLRPVIRQSQ